MRIQILERGKPVKYEIPILNDTKVKEEAFKETKWPNSFQMNPDLNIMFTKDSRAAYKQE